MNHSRWRNTEKLLFIFAFILINALGAFAGPSRTTYQAKIVKPDGYPLEAANVNFKFTILDPAGSCILYSETYSSVNMSATGGLISFALGSGVKTYPVSATTFEQVFSNITPSLSCDAGGPGNYIPGANDNRKIVMQFHDGTGWQTLPAMSINAVPYAMYANDAQKLDGKAASDFVQVSTLANCGASEALRYNGATFSCVAVDTGAGVTSGSVTTALGYTPADGASVTALSSSLATTNSNVSAVSSSVSSVASDVFAVSSTVSSLSTTVSNLTSTVSGISNTVSGLSASMAALVSSQWESNGSKIYYNSGFVGIGTSNPTSALELVSSTASMHINLQGADNSGASVRYFSKRGSQGETLGSSNPSADNKGWSLGSIGDQNPATTRRNNFEASYWNGTAWSVPFVMTASGSVGIGNVVPVTKLDVAGGIRIGAESASCAAGLAGTLRYNAGVVEYCNGTSWAAFGVSGSGILAMNGLVSGSQTFAVGESGTQPNINSAGSVHTFNFPNAASASVTSGLLSNSDYVTFSNKLNATSAAVISVLGYTPADNAASGTYLVKANNLSDLTSATVARTNLGLGALATLNFLDLGSSFASGTLAAARLPAFSGDATSPLGSSVLTLASVGAGVTSGSQYTKVTVDGKGRVVSGAQLTSSDVTTALGFTPGAATSGVTSLNGSTSQTQTFANGSSGNAPAFNTSNGVHTLNIPLASAAGSVTAGLISNADYVSFSNKITSSAAAIAQVLGYTPASATALGNYAVRANNLSDLTSSATARTNLGLGTFATANTIDLGSASATGVIADARLANQTGVVSGTQYTKVTVDGKGRVVSGASLSSSDVTAALGFTPAQSSSSTQWLNNAPSIYYNAGSVGVGTSAPTALLHVARSTGTTIGQTSSGTANAGLLVEGGASGVLAFDGNEIQQFGDTLFLRGENGINFSAGDGADGDSTTPMVITRTSRVGFGTTNPLVPNHFYRSSTLGSVGALNLNNAIVRISESASTTLNLDGNTIAAEDDLYVGTKGAGVFQVFTSDTVRMAIGTTGNVGIGVNSASAKLHLASGTTSIAPLKFTSGALTTAAQAGAVEYDGANLYFTDSTNTRRALTTGSAAGSIDNASTINSTGNITMVPVGSVVVSSTTPSTNSSTGALIVKGGLGVAGDIYASGTIVTSADIQGLEITATSATITPYVYGSTVSGGSLRLESTTHASKGNVLLASGGGNVGVNISNPSSPLHVQGSAGSATVPWMTLEGGGSTLDNVALRLFDRGSATVNNNSLEFAHLGAGSVPVATARMRSLSTGSFASSGSSLILETASDASGTWNTSQFVLNRNGAVGIGTSSPNYLMDLYGSASPTLRIRSASNDPASGPTIRLTEDLTENGGFVRYHSLNNSLDLGVIESAAETAVLSMNRTTGKVTMNAVSGTGLLVDLDARTTGDSELLLQADGDDSNENDNPFVHFEQDNNQIHGYLGLVGNPGDGFNFNITDSAANAMVMNSTSAQLQLATSNTVRMTITQSGYTGIGVSTPTARLQVMAGSTGAAPIKMTAGTLLTTPQSGAFEYDGTDFYVTDSSNTRRTIATATTAGTLDNVTVVSSPSGIALWPAAGNSVTVSATTASTNSSTGALIVKGGVGVAGNIYSSGTIITSSNIQGSEVTATSATITPYVYGSTASGGSLRLEATTHASKGNVLLAAGGGNVGIGHTAPTSVLDIRKVDPVVKIKNTGGDIGGMFLMNSANTGWLGLFNPSTSSAFGVVASSTSRAFLAWDSSGKVGTVTDSFTTTPGAPAYRVILDDGNGQMGIGTTTPTYTLDVISSGTNVARFTGNHVVVNATSGNPNFSLHEAGTLKWSLGEISTDDRFRISNASATERLTILQSGNVGIGTTNPEANLHVMGTARIGADATSYMNFDVGQDITALNPGTTTTVGSVIEGGISRSLILDLKNNNVDDAFAIRYSSANNNVVDAIGFVMRGNGNVGIGTSAPTTNLDIVESINGDTTVNVRNINTGTSARSGFTLTNSGTTYGSDSAGLFLSGTGHSSGEKVSLFSNSSIASGVEIVANASTAAVMFSTQGLERMRVTNTGNVGIGTITPTGKLGIVSGGQVINLATGGNTSAYTLNVGLNDDGINFETPSTVRGYNFKNGNGTLATITATGSVGIGTATPGAQLEVQGDTLGTVLNNVIEVQRWTGSLGGNGSKLDVRHIRTAAGSTWNDAGTRIQQKIDATWMGYMQFNGSGNDGGIIFGTGQTTTAPGNVTERLRITQAGNIGINTASPGYPLDVNGVVNIAAASSLRFGGTIVCTSTGCTASSDRRLKEHIQPLDFSLEKLLSLNAVQYDWKDKEKFGKQHEIGFIAQDLEKVYPEVVRTDKDSGFKSVSYDKLVAPIIEALKVFNARIMKLFDRTEQNAREIASVKQENAELKARVEKTEKENEELKKRLDRIEKALTNSNTK